MRGNGFHTMTLIESVKETLGMLFVLVVVVILVSPIAVVAMGPLVWLWVSGNATVITHVLASLWAVFAMMVGLNWWGDKAP